MQYHVRSFYAIVRTMSSDNNKSLHGHGVHYSADFKYRASKARWLGPFYSYGLALINYKVWDEIMYPFPIFNGCNVEVWEWMSNYIPYWTCDYLSINNSITFLSGCEDSTRINSTIH